MLFLGLGIGSSYANEAEKKLKEKVIGTWIVSTLHMGVDTESAIAILEINDDSTLNYYPRTSNYTVKGVWEIEELGAWRIAIKLNPGTPQEIKGRVIAQIGGDLMINMPPYLQRNFAVKRTAHKSYITVERMRTSYKESMQKRKKTLATLSSSQYESSVKNNKKYTLPFSSGQKWKGSYTCDEGKTNLLLLIGQVNRKAEDSSSGPVYPIVATFYFINGSIKGAFVMKGGFLENHNRAEFEPKMWLSHPKGYSMVGMSGEISQNGKKYTGMINHNGCQGFEVALSD